jgi:hypothetical protein
VLDGVGELRADGAGRPLGVAGPGRLQDLAVLAVQPR